MPPSKMLVPTGVLSPGGANKRRRPGDQLWASVGELSFEVLAFLNVDHVSKLACCASALREACCVCGAGGWRLVTPHLQLTSGNCARWVQQAWFPCVKWLDAHELNVKACMALSTGLQRRGPCAAHGLISLDLRNTKLSGSAEMVVAALRSCSGLRSLNLSRTRLRDDGAERLAYGLATEDEVTGRRRPHASLRFLALDEIGLTRAAGPALAAAAMAIPTLEELVLGRNEIGDETALAISEALWRAGSAGSRAGAALLRLDLSENKLTAEGLASLAGSMAAHGFLQSLDLGGNEHVGVGLTAKSDYAQQVADGLRSAATLQHLHLWRCGLDDEAASIIVDSEPPRLKLLNLAANPFSQDLRGRLLRHKGYGACPLSIRV